MPEAFVNRSTVLRDGTTIAFRYRQAAQSDDRVAPLLALPGLGMPAEIWFAVAAGLQPNRSIAIVDPRGSGLSDPIDGEADGGLFAADAVGVMDHCGWAEAHVAGISMGSMIAQHVAVRYPERVRSLTLVSSYARAGAWTRLVWQLRLALTEGGDADIARLAAALFLTAPHTVDHDPAVIDRLMHIWASSTTTPHSYLSQMRFCATHDLHAELELLVQQRLLGTLVIDAQQDLLCPSTTSRELAELLSARLVQFAMATHLVVSEKPTELAQEIDTHLAAFDNSKKR
jgi:pimeloyl-ACP methyl ester carboxylesterase